MDIEDKVDILEKAATNEGTEVGDMWRCLNYLYHYKQYLHSESFSEKLDEEIELQYEYYKTIEQELE